MPTNRMISGVHSTHAASFLQCEQPHSGSGLFSTMAWSCSVGSARCFAQIGRPW